MNYYKTISAFNQKETIIMKTNYLIFSLWLKHSFETPLRNFKLSLNPKQERSGVSFRQCNKDKKGRVYNFQVGVFNPLCVHNQQHTQMSNKHRFFTTISTLRGCSVTSFN